VLEALKMSLMRAIKDKRGLEALGMSLMRAIKDKTVVGSPGNVFNEGY
jgi:hypothetical protein